MVWWLRGKDPSASRSKGVVPMEQRKHPRYRFHCEIWLLWKEESVAGTVTDLSMGGCKFESEASIHFGKCLALQIYLFGQEAPLHVEQATVRWAREEEFGLAFISMQPEEQERLCRFVSTLQTEQSH